VWDASGGVRPVAAADAAHPLLVQPDVDAERSVALARGVLAQAERFLLRERSLARWELPDAGEELCIPDAVQSVERSFAAQAFEAQQMLAVLRPDEERLELSQPEPTR
jgi:hypothetical protein